MTRGLVIFNLLCVSGIAASAEPPRELSDAVQRYIYQYVTDVDYNETFRFALGDLNGDGRADAIVLMSGPRWCGSGGCTMLIFQGVENGFEFVSQSTISNPPDMGIKNNGAWLANADRFRKGERSRVNASQQIRSISAQSIEATEGVSSRSS